MVSLFVAIFVASLEVRIGAPVLLMTTHNYTNLVAFNANTGAFITSQLLDLSHHSRHLDLPGYVKNNELQFRSIVPIDGRIAVANGQYSAPFIATFECSTNPGWKLNSYFANNTEYIRHPYGLAFDSTRRWWIFSTQDTGSVFIYDEHGSPLSLPGMQEHYPGALFTLVNGTNGIHMDTYLNHSSPPFSDESKKERKHDKRLLRGMYGLRGVCVDEQLGLIFVALELFGTIAVFDMEQNFTNVYNISFDGNAVVAPISVVNGAPYFPLTLFVSERHHDNGVYAVRYTKHGYSIWWQAERSPLLHHATGIAVSADSLFVVSQGKKSILRYNPYSGRYISRLVHFEDDNPSHIVTHHGIGKLDNPIDNRVTLGEQLLFTPSSDLCAVR